MSGTHEHTKLTEQAEQCPHCSGRIIHYKNPAPTVDALIFTAKQGILLIKRKNPPYGWALPGGFIDYGETVEHAVLRELKEETGLIGTTPQLLGVYSDPARDARQHTISIVFEVTVQNLATLCAGDDAAAVAFWPITQLPVLAFDHKQIIEDFLTKKQYS